MSDTIAIIGAPSSAGAYSPGQEKTPTAFRRYGLLEALKQSGWEVKDRGDVETFRWRPDPKQPSAMNLDAVQRIATAVAEHISEAFLAQEVALVLGGDCTIELGVVAGALRTSSSVGLIYIDGDADLNVPSSAAGALDWMVLGHLLDLPGALDRLSTLGPRKPMLSAQEVMLFGAETITPSERQTIEEKYLKHVPLSTVNSNPAQAAERALDWAARFDKLLVHLDMDVMSFTDFPIADNVRYEGRREGFSLEDLSIVLTALLGAPNLCALTLTEINPDHAPDEAESFHRMIDILSQALRRTFGDAHEQE